MAGQLLEVQSLEQVDDVVGPVVGNDGLAQVFRSLQLILHNLLRLLAQGLVRFVVKLLQNVLF